MRVLVTLCLMIGVAQADAPDDVRKQLATSFAKKDLAAIDKLVSDPYSGLRWCSGWDDATWKQTARALQDAKPAESTKGQRVYKTMLGGRARRVVFDSNDGVWKLELDSLLGPFPHM